MRPDPMFHRRLGSHTHTHTNSVMDLTAGSFDAWNTTISEQLSLTSDQTAKDVNWMTTLAPLIMLILLLMTGTTAYFITRRKRLQKMGKQDPAVSYDPDPIPEEDILYDRKRKKLYGLV